MLNLDFKFKPSRIYIAIMLLVLLIASGVVITLPIVFILRLAGLMMIAMYGSYILWHFGFLRSSKAVLGLRKEKNGSWLVKLRYQEVSIEILGDSLVTSVVTVLRFKLPNHRLPQSCIILPDSLNQKLYRRLRMALRMT